MSLLLLATIERLDGQRLDVDDWRLKPPSQNVHRGRMVPDQQHRLDGTYVTRTKHSAVDAARFVVLFPV